MNRARKRRFLFVGLVVAVGAVAASYLVWRHVPLRTLLRRPPSAVHVNCSLAGPYCLEIDVWYQGALGADIADVYVRRATDRRRSFVAGGAIYEVPTTNTWIEDDRFKVELRDKSNRWRNRTFRIVDNGGDLRVVEE